MADTTDVPADPTAASVNRSAAILRATAIYLDAIANIVVGAPLGVATLVEISLRSGGPAPVQTPVGGE